MARAKTKRVASSSSEDDYDRSTATADSSPVPNSRKSAKLDASQQSVLDKENSFTEADMAPSHAPGTAKKPLHTHNRGQDGGTPTKRRLSSRADNMRRQSFANLRLLDASSSAASIDPQSSGSQPASTENSGPQQQQQSKQSGGRIAGLAAVRGRTSLGGNASSLLGSDGNPTVSRQAMTENYEEWMKMATDNKINTTNTWNFALIDYFHDMSLLRNTDGDGSINFQKASCTLDGCVKIWTSRVDSTATAVGKLMSGLAEETSGGGDQADDDEDVEGGDEDGGNQARKKRTTKRTTATLAEDFSKIQQKQLDLEFNVDPLFRKTCADFDEGGASGILMNHLGCDREMRVIFDAGDCKMDDPGDDDSSDEQEEQDNGPTSAQRVDVGKLLASHLPDLDRLNDMVICPTLSSFKFSSDDSALDLDFFKHQNDREDTHISDSDLGATFEAGAQFDGGDGQEDFFADEIREGDHGQDDGVEDFFEAGNGADDDADDEEQGYYVQPQNQAGSEESPALAMGEKQQGVFDYFDAAFSRNWAGPEHWKMRRAPPAPRKDDDPAAATLKQRKVKEPFVIDFEGPSDVKAADLFAKPKARAPATVLKSMPAEDGNSYLLPDDMHFNSASLLRLFLKPKALINMRRRNRGGGASVTAAPALSGGIDQEIDSNYWAQAAHDAGEADFDAGNDMEDPDSAAIPFNTQFLHDDEDEDDDVDMDVGGVDATEPPEEIEDDLLAATQGQKAKRARPEYVSFAKRAKRVDVKRLKENIWKELAIEIPEQDLEHSITEDPEDLPKSFTKVLDGLRKTYPKDKMDEISTSFCFICLLHLANENNLSIKPPKTEAELERQRRNQKEENDAEVKETISNLMALQILRDTTL